MCIQAIFEKIYSYKGEVLLQDVVTCLKALSEDIDNNFKVKSMICINQFGTKMQ